MFFATTGRPLTPVQLFRYHHGRSSSAGSLFIPNYWDTIPGISLVPQLRSTRQIPDTEFFSAAPSVLSDGKGGHWCRIQKGYTRLQPEDILMNEKGVYNDKPVAYAVNGPRDKVISGKKCDRTACTSLMLVQHRGGSGCHVVPLALVDLNCGTRLIQQGTS